MPDQPEFTLRRATVDDAPVLAELGARLFEQAFGSRNTAENMREYLARAFSPAVQTAELADLDRATWIVFDDKDVAIGYAMVRRGSGAPGVMQANPVELQRIYVDQRWQG